MEKGKGYLLAVVMMISRASGLCPSKVKITRTGTRLGISLALEVCYVH
jgi:hypothetical protein